MRPLKRILHIEDVPSIQIVTRIALERIDFVTNNAGDAHVLLLFSFRQVSAWPATHGSTRIEP